MSQKKSIVLVGAPNSGKTTLFNQLTGQHAKTINYPGSTIDFCIGKSTDVSHIHYIDTPGIHSLDPLSDDEKIALTVLTQLHQLTDNTHTYPDLIVSVIDLHQASRHLVLTQQLLHHGYPVIVVATMKDRTKTQPLSICLDSLQDTLKTSIVHINSLDSCDIQLVKNLIHHYPYHSYLPKPYEKKDIKDTYKDIEHILDDAHYHTPEPSHTFDLDTFFLHPVFAPIIFIGIMSLFFYSLFALASPFMSFIDWTFTSLNQTITALLPSHWMTRLLSDGLINGMAAIIVFVPQIALLFFGIGLLESTGYLARGAILVDKPLSLIGLNGRCFLPLLSGFSCAIPALLATRHIQQQKTKLICCFIIPLMQCSARLPVYGLLLTLLFGHHFIKSALVFTSIYVGSLLLAALVALAVAPFIPGNTHTHFNIELPTWKMPHWKNMWRQVFRQTASFITNAGPMIMGISIVLWVLSTYPHEHASYAMAIGQWIEPLVAPMGLDWRVGVAILLSFAAREVFVSVLVLLFSIGQPGESIVSVLTQATFQNSSQLIFTPASIAALLVFFMIAMQCGSTLAVARKEMNSYRYPIAQLILYILLAYGLSIAVFQLVSLFL